MKLNSDQQGARGEARFEETCAAGGLICNKSTRDRAGWDFVVDFDTTPPSTKSLDNRAGHLSTVFQVKTISERTNTIKLRMSVAERLAKDVKPSFIYVLKLDADGNFASAYLIHFRGERLAEILKKLRAHTATNVTKPINHREVTLRIDPRERIELGGPALRAAIEREVDGDMQAYAAGKARDLETLGYSGPVMQMRAELHISSEEEFIDLMLGLRGATKASKVKITETRFGIPIPVEAMQDGTIEIQPHPLDECTVTVRGRTPQDFATIHGNLFIPSIPGLPLKKLKTLIKSKLVNLTYSDDNITFTFLPNAEKDTPVLATAQEWLMHCRFMRIIHSNPNHLRYG